MGLLTFILQILLTLRYHGITETLDLPLLYIYLVSILWGFEYSAVLAVLLGLLMDIYLLQVPVFHLVVYLLPSALALARDYRYLSDVPALLYLGGILQLLVKVFIYWVLVLALGYIQDPYLLFRTNYWGIVVAMLLFIFLSPSLVRFLGKRERFYHPILGIYY